MIETLIITVMLTVVTFAALQLCIMVVNDLVCNEASFATLRSAVVSGNDEEVQNRAKTAAAIILLPHFSSKNFIPLDSRIEESAGKEITAWNGKKTAILKSEVRYATSVMFPSLTNPVGPTSFYYGGSRLREQYARARLVRSPDKECFDRAYYGAQKFE